MFIERIFSLHFFIFFLTSHVFHLNVKIYVFILLFAKVDILCIHARKIKKSNDVPPRLFSVMHKFKQDITCILMPSFLR